MLESIMVFGWRTKVVSGSNESTIFPVIRTSDLSRKLSYKSQVKAQNSNRKNLELDLDRPPKKVTIW